MKLALVLSFSGVLKGDLKGWDRVLEALSMRRRFAECMDDGWIVVEIESDLSHERAVFFSVFFYIVDLQEKILRLLPKRLHTERVWR